mgnify:CR=1 FL=1
MATPRLTVITPAFNHGLFIERTVCSVLDQGCRDVEYLVIDAGSLDDTTFVLRDYEDSLTWWESRRHGQIAAAVNEALLRAKGQWVWIVPAGDVLLPCAVDAVLREIEQHEDRPGWFVAGCERINEQDESLCGLDTLQVGELGRLLLHDREAQPLAGMVFSRDLVAGVGMLDESVREMYGLELQCRLLASGIEPTRLSSMVAGIREYDDVVDAQVTLTRGIEAIEIAERYTDALPLGQRYALMRVCDQRRRIQALAAAELFGERARPYLWQAVKDQPKWLTDKRVRHALVHGPAQAVPLDDRITRRAA